MRVRVRMGGVLWELSWGSQSATPAAQKPRHAAWEADLFKETNATLHGNAPGAQGRPKELFMKIVDFLLKMLVFHWKSVCLEPTEAFYITF